jgi:hypothetical protein
MVDVPRASAWTLYRDYLIGLEQTRRGWRIVEITHCMVAAKNFYPSCVYHREREAAERGGRALIDLQMSKRRQSKRARQATKDAQLSL